MHIFSSLIRVKDCFQIWMYTKSTVAFGVYIMYKYQLLYDQRQDTSVWSKCMWISHIALDFDSITFTYIRKLWIIRHWCFESLARHVATHSLRAASLLLSGSSCTCQVICLEICWFGNSYVWKYSRKVKSHRGSCCCLSKRSRGNSNWSELTSNLQAILLCYLLDQVINLGFWRVWSLKFIFYSSQTWLAGVVVAVAPAIAPSITLVCTSRSSKVFSNLSITYCFIG